MFKKGERMRPKFNFFFFLIGGFLLILGVGLILLWWEEVAILFKGAVGVGLALVGLLILYIASQKIK